MASHASASVEETGFGLAPLEVEGPTEGDEKFWSVTTMIDALDKPALKYWSAGMVADAAIDSEATWHAMMRDRGRYEAWKWLRDAFKRPARHKLSNKDLGSIVHGLIEEYGLTGRKPTRERVRARIAAISGAYLDLESETDLAALMLDRFDAWAQRFQPAYAATEVVVYSHRYGYAGTADAFATVEGVRFLLDYKTSRDPFDTNGKPKTPFPVENSLQLAGYANADLAAWVRPRRFEGQWKRRYYLLGPEERHLARPLNAVFDGEPIDQGLIIHITPEVCEGYPCRCDGHQPDGTPTEDSPFFFFLHTIECWRWVQEESKRVMGDPLQ